MVHVGDGRFPNAGDAPIPIPIRKIIGLMMIGDSNNEDTKEDDNVNNEKNQLKK